jgi:hypothetical protein
MRKAPFPPTEYLKLRVGFEEVETESQRRASEYGVPVSPHSLKGWDAFKAQFVDGDDLWFWEYMPAPMTRGAG